MRRIVLVCLVMFVVNSGVQGATGALETWDDGLANGWTGNTVVATVEGRSSGGNPDGWLFSYGTGYGTMDIGASTHKSDFTGNYQTTPIHRVSVDVSLINGDFDAAWIRFRYMDSSHNGWLYPLSLSQDQGWQSFVVDFDPNWSDDEARSAGWMTDEDVLGGNPSESFETTLSDVYTAEVRLSGQGYLEAGIDNFKINGSLIADHFEPNNQISKAINLGMFSQSRTGLSIHEPGEEDWYQWNAITSGDLMIDLSFLHNEGDLQLEVYNSDGQLLSSSKSVDDNEQIIVQVSADELYNIRVYGNYRAINPRYRLDLMFGDSENYAVLFAGGSRVAKNFTRYYDNVKNMYEHLVDVRGLDPGNIYVLYADGTDAADDLTSGGVTSNSDMSYAQNVLEGTGANLEDVLVNILGPKIDMNDHFFLWTFDHGGGDVDDPDTSGEETLTGWNVDADNNVSDEDLAVWLNSIHAGRYTLVFGQCFAGGMLDDLEPLSNRVHGCSATNHYEYSWGDAFVVAYLEGLELFNNTHDVYQYAYEHDAYATDGEGPGGDYAWTIEHPWESTTTNFPIFAKTSNGLPWIKDIRELRFKSVLEKIIISHELLVAASVAGDPDLKQLSFRVESVDAGMLFKGGDPVVPGQTIVGPGESLEFIPVVPLSISNASLTLNPIEPLNAFTVRAFDGITVSDESIAVPLLFSDDALLDAVDDSVVINEDSVGAVIDVLDNDQGQTPLSVLSVGVATHGTVELVNGQVLYSPAAELSGIDSFIYFMVDGSGGSDWASVSVMIEAVNDPPEAYTDKFSVLVDSVDNLIDVLDNDFDPESKPLTYFIDQSGPYPISAIITIGPSHGIVVPTSDGRFLYTPVNGFLGEDSFSYQASDGEALSEEVQVTIDVSTCPEPCVDSDGDGYGLELDCDDNDANVNPAAKEVCDSKDNDCDGAIDEDVYVFGGFGKPINVDGSSIFKTGRTIPVKIRLEDCGGVNVGDGVVYISVAKVTNVILGSDEQQVDSSGSANTGSMFRYDMDDQQYIYNLSTKSMSAGTYKLSVIGEQGVISSVNISLR